MKSLIIFTVLTLTSLLLLADADPVSRVRRQLFPLFAASTSSSSSSTTGTNSAGAGAGSSAGSGSFGMPWFGSLPSPSNFQLPKNIFPNPDEVRQRAQDYISGKILSERLLIDLIFII